MSTPHDHLFRHTFGQPEHATGLFQCLLPESLVRAIGWKTLTPCPGSFVDEELRGHHADLLFTVDLGGQSACLYLLLEHKSRSERFTALQVLRYVLRIWDRHCQEHPGARCLPPVIPIVVHHGENAWQAPTRLRSLVELRGLAHPVAEAVASCQPEFTFLLDDLARASESELADRLMSATARLTLLFLQHIRGRPPESALAAIERWAGLLRAVMGADPHSGLFALLSYLLRATDLPRERFRSALATWVGPEAEAAMMTTAERIAQEAQADLLLRQLTSRFGPLPPETVSRVRTASRADLERWAEAVLTARTLDEVFA